MEKNITEGQRRSRANLKPFQKGQSGNPGGKPSKARVIAKLLTDEMKEMLDEVPSLVDNQGQKVTNDKNWRELVTTAALRGAAKGNVELIKYVFDRVDGKVPISVDQGTLDGAKDTIADLVRRVNGKASNRTRS